MQFLTDFADQAVILPLALVVGFALIVVGWLRGALAWWFAVAATLGVMLVLKLVLIACGHHIPELNLRSPSGHTASAAVVYGGIIGLAFPNRSNPFAKVIGVLVLALLFGTTRLALDVHSVPEVLLGGLVGLLGALMLVRLAGERPASTPPRRLGLLIGATVIVVSLALHGRHLAAEKEIDQLTFTTWPLSACR